VLHRDPNTAHGLVPCGLLVRELADAGIGAHHEWAHPVCQVTVQLEIACGRWVTFLQTGLHGVLLNVSEEHGLVEDAAVVALSDTKMRRTYFQFPT
jgi:hypothetical protein